LALSVEQLVARRELGTRVVAGAAGTGRQIGWAHVCELPDPWQWVGEGDLLMTTGLGIPASADGQVEYVERLASVGAAGVALGENMEAPPIQQVMLDTADRNALPLMLTRYEIPFIALARAVAEANTEEHLARITQTENVYEVLRRSSAEDLGLADLVGLLEAVVACELCVVDPVSGRSLVRGKTVPLALAETVDAWTPGAGEEAPATLDVPDATAAGVVVPSPRHAVLLAWTAKEGLPDFTVLRHIAAAIALHQTRQFAERERSLRLGATLLAQVLDQRISVSAARSQLASVGLGEVSLLLAACAAAPDEQDLHLLHHLLEDVDVPHLMLNRPPLIYVLLRDEATAVAGLAQVLSPAATAGISDPVTSPAELPTALREARWALHRAQERRLTVLHHSDDLGDSVFLPGDREDSRAAARRVLGEVLAYDEAHAGQLLDSLRVFLQENRSWQRAATSLHIHKQTLVYRMRRVEELTSRSLSDTGDVADLWLALQAATSSGLIERRTQAR
jgi:PucR family transcriptional regulator, purine catabolism regulatory protein